MWIIAVIVMFFLLVIGHELWHFITARYAKVKVLEFGIGIPPKIKKLWKDKKWTNFTLNLLPLWWFVRLKWENPNSKDFLDKDSFIATTFPKKILILLWWIIANILIAYCILVVVFSLWTKPLIIIPDNAIATPTQSYIMPNFSFAVEKGIIKTNIVHGPANIIEVLSWSRADDIWIKAGDRIIQIDDTTIDNQTLKEQLQKKINQTFTIQRQSVENQIQRKNLTCNEECLLGIILQDESTYDILEQKTSIIESMKKASSEVWQQSRLTIMMLGQIIQKATSKDKKQKETAFDSLTGPVWATKIGANIWEQWSIKLFLIFASIISLGLAVFNLLPIPALDGGRLVSVIIQHLLKSDPKNYYQTEWYVNFFFFLILMTLGIVIIFKDLTTFRWIHIF